MIFLKKVVEVTYVRLKANELPLALEAVVEVAMQLFRFGMKAHGVLWRLSWGLGIIKRRLLLDTGICFRKALIFTPCPK